MSYDNFLCFDILQISDLWYCLALTYKGSSSSISGPGRGILCIFCWPVVPPGTIMITLLLLACCA